MKCMYIPLFAILFAASALAKEMVALPDMNDAMVPTGFEAIKAVVDAIHAERRIGGYRITPQRQFYLSVRLPGFGEVSHRVWPVLCEPSTGDSIRIAWVNADNGKVIFFSLEKEKEPPNHEMQPTK